MKQCKMEGCQCKVAEGKQFCSVECEQNRQAADGRCGCGHADCGMRG